MNTRKNLIGIATLLAVSAFQSPAASQQVDQSTIAARLSSTQPMERMVAADLALTLQPEETSVELRRALIAALAREARQHDLLRRGEVGSVEVPELMPRLALAVAAFSDANAIPALVGALGSSPPAVDALASFGEPAVRPIVRVVRDGSDASVVGDGLVALRFLAEGVGGALSPAARAEVRDVARERVSGQQSVTVLWQAIDLAVALGDPELRDIVQAIAASDQEAVARGVTEPDLIARTRARAEDRLAGVAAQPTWTPREDWIERRRGG